MNSKKNDGSSASPSDSPNTRICKRTLPSFSQSNNNFDFQDMNGQPVQKKPKLDINVYSSQSCSNSKNFNKGNDCFDDLWGDDPDSSALEMVDFEETLALSQITEVVKKPQILNAHCSKALKLQCNQVTEINFHKQKDNKPVCNNSKIMPPNHMRNSPRVPLRRTASSGWPSANTFSSQSSNITSISKDNFDRRNNSTKPICTSNEYQLKAEIENLKEQLMKKTGEVNLIRSRLNKLESDYVDKIDSVRQEAETKCNKLLREIKSLKGQLDVQTMELETAERKAQHMNSISRLNPDSPNNRTRSGTRPSSHARGNDKSTTKENQLMTGRGHIKAKSCTLSLELLRKLITPELLRPSQPEPTISESVRTITKPSLFSGIGTGINVRPEEPSTSSSHKSRSFFYPSNVVPEVKQQISKPCASLEPCSLSLLSSRLLDIDSNNGHQTITEVLDSCHSILKDQLLQLETAFCPQNKYLEREQEILHHSHKYLTLTEDYNLLSSKELYNNERGICTRRTLVLVSLLVDLSEFAASLILPSCTPEEVVKSTDNTSSRPNADSSSSTACDLNKLLITVKDIVCAIEKQRRTLMFEGVLAGATVLIKSFVQADLELSKQSQDLVLQTLRGVVFARPGSLVLHNTLQVLLTAVKYPAIMDSLCHNSVKKTFVDDTVHSVVTYNTDTCLLQVLLVLLQVDRPRKHVLADLFTAWVLALFYGGPRTPRWLFSAPSQTTCRCRPLVSRLAFTLLGEACCLHPSVSDTNNEKKLLEKLLTRGILLVSTLLLHDEHFGANVDPASVGYYELFLHSMNKMDIKLSTTYREILESLCLQESFRQPIHSCEGESEQLNKLLER